MTSSDATGEDETQGPGSRNKRAPGSPAWTDGLKQLYDEVVDEPLPDAFKDLLAQLDDEDDPDASPETGGAG